MANFFNPNSFYQYVEGFLIWLSTCSLSALDKHIMWCAMLSKKGIWTLQSTKDLTQSLLNFEFIYFLLFFRGHLWRLVKEATKEWVSQNWKYFFRMPKILNMWVASANHGNLNPVIQKIARVLTWVSNLGGLTFRKTWMWCASKKFGTSTMPWL